MKWVVLFLTYPLILLAMVTVSLGDTHAQSGIPMEIEISSGKARGLV